MLDTNTIIPALGHEWGSEWLLATASHHEPSTAECNGGIDTRACVRCGAIGGGRPAGLACLGTDGIVVDLSGAVSDDYTSLNVTHLCIPPAATSIGYRAFYKNVNIQSVRGGANLTTIGEEAFYQCGNLLNADFPAVTTLDVRAIFNCIKLTDVSFPAATTIGDSALIGCSNLLNASFPKASSVGAYAFSGCYRLKSADFPELSFIDSRAFFDCDDLAVLYFPKATGIANNAFSPKVALIDITIAAPAPITGPDFGTMGFPEGLVTVYNATGGGPGRYTRVPPSTVWTKQ